jgi:hypothetical protein
MTHLGASNRAVPGSKLNGCLRTKSLATSCRPIRFSATDAQAAAHWIHARGLPDLCLDGVDLGELVDFLREALIVPVDGERLLRLRAVLEAGRGIDAAVDAAPAFGHHALQVQVLHRVSSPSW